MSHTIRPTVPEYREARSLVAEALDRAAAAFPMDTDPVVEMRWTEDEFVVAELDGAKGYAEAPDVVEIEFNTAAPAWRDSLRSTAVHEYVHVWDVEQRGGTWETRWEYVLGEALTQHAAEEFVPAYESPWPRKHDVEAVAEYWPQVREVELDRRMDEIDGYDPVFIDDGEGRYPMGLGYSMSYQIGGTLRRERDLESFPHLDRAAVVRAGERLYEDG